MNISPNPVVNDLNIDYRTSLESEITIEVFNLVGQSIMEPVNYNVQVGENNIILNVAEYPNGIYIMRIKQGSVASIKRFVKK